jgi:hypothetical protein
VRTGPRCPDTRNANAKNLPLGCLSPYYEPRIAKSTALVDPTLPGMDPVALNFRAGSGKVLRLQLYPNQLVDVGFLRIFISTKYDGGSLASIEQKSPQAFVDGKWQKPGGRGTVDIGVLRPCGHAEDQDVLDIWDVINIPLVQRAQQVKLGTILRHACMKLTSLAYALHSREGRHLFNFRRSWPARAISVYLMQPLSRKIVTG